jgi:hypothetical protein
MSQPCPSLVCIWLAFIPALSWPTISDDKYSPVSSYLQPPPREKDISNMRNALIKLVNNDNNRVVRSFGLNLKNDPSKSDGGNVVHIGPWRCNVKDRSFRATLVRGGYTITMRGRFEPTADGLKSVLSERDVVRWRISP